MKVLNVVFLAILNLASIGSSVAQDPTISLEDLGALVGIEQPAISPDGSRVVVVISRPNYDENRFDQQLVMVDVATGAQTKLTHQRMGLGAPEFSPDGTRLAFLAHDSDKKTQVYMLPLTGGEAAQITQSKTGVASFALGPSGKRLVYAAVDEKESQHSPNPQNKEANTNEQQTPDEKHNRAFEVGNSVYLASETARAMHLWLIDADGGEPQRLTSGPNGITTFFGRAYNWAPDGNRLVVQFKSELHSTMGRNTAQLELIDVDDGKRTIIEDGDPVPVRPIFSPDGKNLIFNRPVGPSIGFYPSGVFAHKTRGEDEHLTAGIDRDLRSPIFMPDGKSLVVVGWDRTQVSMWQVDFSGKSRQIDLGSVNPAPLLRVSKNGSIAFVGSEANRPPELYILPTLDEKPQRLTAFNKEIASRKLGKVETITWMGPDGFEQNGVLVFPPDFERDKKYPLVLLIHGGPMGTSTEEFSVLSQLLAAQGWIVFSPNYRGSNNQGRTFQSAIINDAGDGPGRDVMSGIDAVKKRGIVDEKKLAVSGWSYGGFMTAWLTAHYEGWTAAVAGSPVTDWLDDYSLSDLNVWVGEGMDGSPWLNGNLDKYRDQSPITYAARIRTPTLILSNTLDHRVPITQPYKLYHALRDNEVPVQFVAYPIPGHFPQDPIHIRDVYRRWVGWIDEHFER